MNATIAKILTIAISVGAIGLFLFNHMWQSTKDNETKAKTAIDVTSVPTSMSFTHQPAEYSQYKLQG